MNYDIRVLLMSEEIGEIIAVKRADTIYLF